MRHILNRLLVGGLLAGAVTAPASAQQAAPSPAPAQAPAPAEKIDLTLLPPTLLFSFEDMRAIESAIAMGPLARGDRPADTAETSRYRFAVDLYLSSIVWSGPRSWTVWINGRPYSPDSLPQGYDIVEVGPDSVLLSVPWGEGGAREVRLATRQTFVPRFGGVIEGRPR